MKALVISLVVVVSISLGMGVWQLDTVPSGVYVDEAIEGYNAYSLALTGKDEFGKPLPQLFRLFGSYTPPMYVYVLVPMVKFFGLNAFSIRLPSVVFGAMSAVCVFAWLMQIFKGNKWQALMGSVMFSISPWMVFNSRLGYESCLGFLLFAIGSYFLWRKKYVRALIILGLSTYAAHAQRYQLPFELILYGLFFGFRNRKLWLAGVALGIVMVPNLAMMSTQAFWIKNNTLNGVSVAEIVHNSFSQLMTTISPNYLFSEIADIDLQHKIPGVALFYWWMVIPFGIGLWLLRDDPMIWVMVLANLVPGIFSGVFTSEQRVLGLLLPLSIIIAVGLVKMVGNRWWLFGGLFGYSLLLLWRSYFVLLPGLMASAWNYEYSVLAEEVKQDTDIWYLIDNSRNPRLYSLMLFHLQFPPDKYQNTYDTEIVKKYYDGFKVSDDKKFGNLEFRAINWEKDECIDQVVVGDELAVSMQQAKEHELVLIGRVIDKTDRILLRWFRTNPQKKCKVDTMGV